MTYDEWKTTPPVDYPDSRECRHGELFGSNCPDCEDELACEVCGRIGGCAENCAVMARERITSEDLIETDYRIEDKER